MKITYRFASPDDVQGISEFAYTALSDTVLPGFAKSVGTDMLQRIELHPGNVLLAETVYESMTRIIAYIEIDAARIRENAFYIRGIYVLPEYRRLGVGRKLLRMILEKKCTGGQQLRAESFSEFETKFWESLGFRIHHTSLSLTKED